MSLKGAALDEINQYILDTDYVLSCKINCPYWVTPEEGEEYDQSFLDLIDFAKIEHYFVDKYDADIKAVSAGIHYLGKHKIRHIHYVVISSNFKKTSNPTSDRKTFMKKHGAFYKQGVETFEWSIETQFKPIKEHTSKYACLSYPLKEGHAIRQRMWLKGFSMRDYMVDFLLSVGTKIYQQAKALKERKDKADELRASRLVNLFEYCDEVHHNRFRFLNLTVMREYLDSHYLKNIPLEDLPCPVHFLRDCKKVAFQLGIWKYSDQVE